MRVLVVNDRRAATEEIEAVLASGRFGFETVGDGESAIEYMRSLTFDAIVIDPALPDVHGYDVIRLIRQHRIETPVLIVSDQNDINARLDGFAAGADDYVAKPFKGDELVARLHALVRRSRGHGDSIVRTGTMTIDLIGQFVSVAGRRIHLANMEYAVLELLALNKGAIVSKDSFLSHLYGALEVPGEKIIDVYVCKIRQKLALAGAGAATCIETYRGSGYVLRDPDPPG